MSRHNLFARDIRAEGWAEGVDRTNDAATICVQRRWEERLAVAERWARDTGRIVGGFTEPEVAYALRRRWVERGSSTWEPLDPPRPLFEEYVGLLRRSFELGLSGEPQGRALAEVDGLSALEPVSSSLTSVVECSLRWLGKW